MSDIDQVKGWACAHLLVGGVIEEIQWYEGSSPGSHACLHTSDGETDDAFRTRERSNVPATEQAALTSSSEAAKIEVQTLSLDEVRERLRTFFGPATAPVEAPEDHLAMADGDSVSWCVIDWSPRVAGGASPCPRGTSKL